MYVMCTSMSQVSSILSLAAVQEMTSQQNCLVQRHHWCHSMLLRSLEPLLGMGSFQHLWMKLLPLAHLRLLTQLSHCVRAAISKASNAAILQAACTDVERGSNAA
ncbi:uncharacterized protein M421DRAFT_107085 [Didymella exigua CBS 183.55]|uniref:Uncharacterized protein n=1 Tax=Didymella exigua CBS 183.55 TaxID=1150837 RepID=A0A6A5S5U8_9PLEO|nr:uncharacterized protein M421DRAFT_107085 [Didymella exigua CBS 183.55]KAF1933876.1 hypothetical protein M421DRAFT_107085 [Didymella exigua CBS 183.55]